MSKTKPIVFSGNFISIDDKRLDILKFKENFNLPTESENLGNTVHTYLFEFEENFLKIIFSDGSTFPRNPNVINTKTNLIEPNPRQPNQIEPKEYFALIDFETCFFWINSGKKRKILVDFLQKKFIKNQIVVKDIFNQDEFIKSLKKLDDIRITAIPDLLSSVNTLTQALSDEINQYEAVEAILHLKYQDKWVGNNLSTKISSIFNNRENFRGIMISGRDERNQGLLFNTNVFSRKIEFKTTVDENEMFDSNEVFRILIGKINDEKK
ncbi:MAG: hypothetical protein VB066_02905 [Paludibacter sp.]|nr:hypothetical protein [Paludibacter sp.]